jgi:hypothetical protein
VKCLLPLLDDLVLRRYHTNLKCMILIKFQNHGKEESSFTPNCNSNSFVIVLSTP